MSGISAKLPLTRDIEDGIKLNKSFQDVVKQNLMNLILTNPGERIMIPEFGVGLSTFLFEQNTIQTRQLLAAKIREQVNRYLPIVEITDVKFSSTNDDNNVFTNFLNIGVEFNIIPLDEIDSLNLIADETNQLVRVQDDDLTRIS